LQKVDVLTATEGGKPAGGTDHRQQTGGTQLKLQGRAQGQRLENAQTSAPMAAVGTSLSVHGFC